MQTDEQMIEDRRRRQAACDHQGTRHAHPSKPGYALCAGCLAEIPLKAGKKRGEFVIDEAPRGGKVAL